MKIKLKDLIGRFYKLDILRRACIQEATADIGLYFGQLPILEYVIEHDQCTQKEIADAIHVTPASVAISTKRMQKAGLLEKTVSNNNLRCNRLTVTLKGRELSRQYRSKFDEVDQKMFASFAESELEQFGGYLDRLIMNISNEASNDISIYAITALAQKIKKKNRSTKRLSGGRHS